MDRLTFVVLGAVLGAATPAGAQTPRPAAASLPIHFVTHTIDTALVGGYQVVVADLDRDGKPDLIALGDGLGELRWYQNPAWRRHVIVSGLTDPINVAAADIDGDGIPEIALASGFDMKYAGSPGIVSILSHQGDPSGPWTAREVDRLPTAHRLRFADLDGSGRKALVNAPLIGPRAVAPEYRDHLPLVVYRPPDWKREVISEAEEGVVHGLTPARWEGTRESILTAGFLGVHAYRFDRGRWTRATLTAGDPSPWPKSGASEIAVGRLGRERFFATIEPWHGHRVAVYRRAGSAWRRQVIDSTLVDGHVLVTGDFDGDGHDELVAAERGGKRAVYLYRLERRTGRWIKDTIDGDGIGAPGCAVADLNGDGRPDVVCIGSVINELRWYENQRR